MLAEGDYFRYNQMVSEYNARVRYNQDLEAYQAISDEYSRLAERYNYIISHEHDRERNLSLFIWGQVMKTGRHIPA